MMTLMSGYKQPRSLIELQQIIYEVQLELEYHSKNNQMKKPELKITIGYLKASITFIQKQIKKEIEKEGKQ